ncbi:MAG TPA: sulfite exporter TauE/SafE family protein [Chlamydiales bacterium]|nr:sulfite exporter TauE/SafE family protein [Chlamydiales bacterium]
MIIFLFIVIGLVTGLLAGLLGIGGGIISVPSMFYILHLLKNKPDNLMQICVATALATTLITSLGSTISHHKKKTHLPHVLKIVVPGLVVGCILGAIGSTFLSSRSLQFFFGTISILFAVYFFFPKLPQMNIAPHPNRSLSLFGVLIGILSSLLGVGGGIFLIPVFLGYQISLHNTVASSSASTLATALAGTIIYLYLGFDQPTMPYTIGYIYVPGVLLMGISSLLTTSTGVKLAHILPPTVTKRLFSVVLVLTGLSMIFLK